LAEEENKVHFDDNKKWTYFNEDFKHRKVDQFCAWYLKGNKDKLRTTNASKPKRLTEEEKDALEQDYPFIYRKRRKLDYASFSDKTTARSSALPIARFPAELRDVPDFVDTRELDERFKNLGELVHRYAGMTKDEEPNNDATFKELYRLIMLLSEEKRIDEGKGFELEPYGRTELAAFKEQMKVIETACALAHKRIDSTNKVIRKALKEGRVIKA